MWLDRDRILVEIRSKLGKIMATMTATLVAEIGLKSDRNSLASVVDRGTGEWITVEIQPEHSRNRRRDCDRVLVGFRSQSDRSSMSIGPLAGSNRIVTEIQPKNGDAEGRGRLARAEVARPRTGCAFHVARDNFFIWSVFTLGD